ncbi:MAG: aromatic ring-hydroxylating dioxygenase subunit alpha [Gammaproteobacteria bacterium]|nr:aromatic ring-hydroxylating dioxygenase subunit alpha [Gammaproteobacteria bacterium]
MSENTAPAMIPPSRLASVRQAIGSAGGLPNEAYDKPALFEFERDTLMATSWVSLAFSSKLPKNGFAKPVDFMGLPLLIMRNRDGEIKVFHNVCSHRGMILLREETDVEVMVRCPYHSWTYDLDGKLRGTPHIGGVGCHRIEGFEREEHGLKEVRTAVWLGVIFINLSGDAKDFGRFIRPLTERWEGLAGKDGLSDIHPAANGSHAELTVMANWKLAVENYCEAYHLPAVHPALNRYSPLKQHYNLIINDHASGQGSHSYTLSEAAGTTLPQFTAWPKDKLRQAEYIALYPNTLLGIQADHVFTVILQPQANNRTLEKLELSYIGRESTGDQYAACRAAVLDSWRVVFSEDVFAVEGMQNGRKSPGFDGGVFSPAMDEASHHFHCWVADRYAAASSTAV